MMISPFHRCLVIACVFSGACFGQVPSKIDTGTVLLHVVDDFGNPIIPAKVRIVTQGGVDVSTKVSGGVLHDLPYGDYTLIVETPAFQTWKGMVRVAQERMRFTVGLELGPAEGFVNRCPISGELTGVGVRAARRLWIRLLPLFGNDVSEVDVMADGKFSDKIRCGKHILVVMGSEGAIRTVPVDVTMMTKPLSIDIGKGLPLTP